MEQYFPPTSSSPCPLYNVALVVHTAVLLSLLAYPRNARRSTSAYGKSKPRDPNTHGHAHASQTRPFDTAGRHLRISVGDATSPAPVCTRAQHLHARTPRTRALGSKRPAGLAPRARLQLAPAKKVEGLAPHRGGGRRFTGSSWHRLDQRAQDLI